MKKIILLLMVCYLPFNFVFAENWEDWSENQQIDTDSIKINKKDGKYLIGLTTKTTFDYQTDYSDSDPYTVRATASLKSLLNDKECCIKWSNQCDKFLNSYTSSADAKYTKDTCSLNDDDDKLITITNNDNFFMFDDKHGGILFSLPSTYHMYSNTYNVKNKLILSFDSKKIKTKNMTNNITAGLKACKRNNDNDSDYCKKAISTNGMFYKYLYPKIKALK